MEPIALLIFFFSLFCSCNATITKDPEFHLPIQPDWNMVITNLSADASKDFPYTDYSFTLLTGKFTPSATCSAKRLNPIKTKPTNISHPLLGTPWINCHTISTLLDDQNITSEANKRSDLPPQQPANVSFKWTQRGDGGALLKVDTNYTMELGELYALFPGSSRPEGHARDDDVDIFVYQRGTFNISSEDVMRGESYTGAVNLTTKVEWMRVCEGADQCN